MDGSRRRPRKYTGVLQYFHNFEHDPKGRNHCHSDGNHPYSIWHENGKHIISARIACGHGRGGKPQWFRFTRREGKGWDMASGMRTSIPT
ncbi:hypothetical protein LCGC14_0975180 [marine sediment metagenome]|uniref:Uncharacterized protein n=1 Tax=marine sediment metagenome TaxID=412755 RepID=A0A0F9NWN4_9ZZZZ